MKGSQVHISGRSRATVEEELRSKDGISKYDSGSIRCGFPPFPRWQFYTHFDSVLMPAVREGIRRIFCGRWSCLAERGRVWEVVRYVLSAGGEGWDRTAYWSRDILSRTIISAQKKEECRLVSNR